MEHRTLITDVYIQFTAYSVTSASLVRGSCVESSGSSVPLLNPYNAYWLSLDPEITVPNYLTSTPSFSAFINSKSSQLNTRLGYEMCTATSQSSPVVPDLFPSSSAAHLSATKAESSAFTRHTQITYIIILSVIVPIVGLAIFLLCFITIRRNREKRREAAMTNQPNVISDTQLYFDQKAELGDEERRKHEMDAEGTTHEMDGQDRIFELPGHGGTATTLASLQRVHEMRGAEHSTELEAP